jgi:glutamine synthetase
MSKAKASKRTAKNTPKKTKGSDNTHGRAVIADLRSRGFQRAKIGGFDIDGVLRGKYVSFDKLEAALNEGFGFCDVIFGWDVADVLYDNAKLTGWHTGYPDTQAMLDASTARPIPWEPGVVSMLADFRDAHGEPHPACPRSTLKRVLANAEKLGFSAKIGAEYEFFVFRETRDSLVAKGFQNLVPIDPGMFGYSWVRSGQDAQLMRDILDAMEASGIELEGLHTETGPGVYEAALRYDHALLMADKAALFKPLMKQIAHQHGLSVSFMAKWNAALPGCSGHLHQSLWKDGRNAFADPRGKRGISKVMEHFLAGQLALMTELTAVVAPTINSYKRYVPGVWAPTVPTWGVENRTCSLRVIGPGDANALRVEHRQPAADMNPYLAIAATLGAGLYGIEHELALPPEAQGDAGSAGAGRLPRTLREANAALEASEAARSVLGAEFVDHYVRTRDWEVRAYEAAVTDWELKRYFEII